MNDISIALFIGAWIAGLAQSRHPGEFGFGHGFEMASIARSLVEHGTFANPFAPSMTGPTAVVPPLYPLLLAALIKVFGWPLPAALIVNIAFNAVTAALLPRAAQVFFDDVRPGAFAGLLWIAAMPMMPQWDVSWTIACLVLACIYTAHSFGRSAPGRQALAAGLLGGIISLLNPIALLAFLIWMAFLFLTRSSTRSYMVGYTAVLMGTIALCNVPWMARNYGIWHSPLLRTNLGMTLYSSNNDCAQSSLSQDGVTGCYQRTHPIASADEALLMQRLGEVAYDRKRTADTFAWISAHPARFEELTASRIAEFWFPRGMTSGKPLYSVWLVTLLSAAGVLLMIKRREAAAWFLLALWTLYPLTYYVVVSSDRYRFPILWTSLLPAGYCLMCLASLLATRLVKTPIGH